MLLQNHPCLHVVSPFFLFCLFVVLTVRALWTTLPFWKRCVACESMLWERQMRIRWMQQSIISFVCSAMDNCTRLCHTLSLFSLFSSLLFLSLESFSLLVVTNSFLFPFAMPSSPSPSSSFPSLLAIFVTTLGRSHLPGGVPGYDQACRLWEWSSVDCTCCKCLAMNSNFALGIRWSSCHLFLSSSVSISIDHLICLQPEFTEDKLKEFENRRRAARRRDKGWTENGEHIDPAIVCFINMSYSIHFFTALFCL